MEGRMVIKAELGNDIRKILIHNDEVTYDELAIMMQRIFKGAIKPDDEILLKYRDEDGDLITLFDTSDVAFALQASQQYLRVKLFLNGFERSLADDEVRDIKLSLRSMREDINKILDRLGDEHQTGASVTPHADEAEALSAREPIESRTPDVANVIAPDAHEFDPLNQSEPYEESEEPAKLENDRASQYSGSEFGDQSHSFQQTSATTPIQTPRAQMSQSQPSQQPQYNSMGQHLQQQAYAASQASNIQTSQPTTTTTTYGYSQGYQQAQSQAQPAQQSQQYYQTSTPSSPANSLSTSHNYTPAQQQAYYQQMQLQGQQAQTGQLQQAQAGQPQQAQAGQPQQARSGLSQPPQFQGQSGMPQPQQMSAGFPRNPVTSNPYSKPGQLSGPYPRATGMYPQIPAQQHPAAAGAQPQYPPAGQPGGVMNAQ